MKCEKNKIKQCFSTNIYIYKCEKYVCLEHGNIVCDDCYKCSAKPAAEESDYLMLKTFLVVFSAISMFPLFEKKNFSYLFIEQTEGREKERERNINVWLPLARPIPETWPATQACALNRN